MTLEIVRRFVNGEWKTEAAEAGGGGAQPVQTRQDFAAQGNDPIVDGGNGRVSWGHTFGPDELFDRSDPEQPVILESAVYAVAVTTTPLTDITVGGFHSLVLELDANNVDAAVTADSVPASAALPRPRLSLAGTFYVPAGGVIIAHAYNHDGGGAAHIFAFDSAFVQRIS